MDDKFLDRITELEQRARDLEGQLSDPDLSRDAGRYAKVGKELGRLRPILDVGSRYRTVLNGLADSRAMLDDDDPEVAELARGEIARSRSRWRRSRPSCGAAHAQGSERREERDLRDPGRHRRRRGRALRRPICSGCTRAMRRIAGWKVETLVRLGDRRRRLQGESSRRSQGQDVFSRLKYEKRRPPRPARARRPESQGRIHTSTVTVAVMPEAEEVDVEIKRERPADRRDARRRPGRPERQHDRLRGAHHAPADRSRRAVPGREVASTRTRPRR